MRLVVELTRKFVILRPFFLNKIRISEILTQFINYSLLVMIVIKTQKD